MTPLRQKVELIANVAIIAVSVIIIAAFVDRFFVRPSSGTAPAQRKDIVYKGSKAAIADVDWAQSRKNLVLVLSTKCRFCTESMPFYQRLAELRASNENVRMLGVLPQGVEESEKYFSQFGARADRIITASLSDISVQSTPTLLLVDENGTIIESWVGKLPPYREDEVISQVFGEIKN